MLGAASNQAQCVEAPGQQPVACILDTCGSSNKRPCMHLVRASVIHHDCAKADTEEAIMQGIIQASAGSCFSL